jgi:hypothetical protein
MCNFYKGRKFVSFLLAFVLLIGTQEACNGLNQWCHMEKVVISNFIPNEHKPNEITL